MSEAEVVRESFSRRLILIEARVPDFEAIGTSCSASRPQIPTARSSDGANLMECTAPFLTAIRIFA